MSDSTVIWFVQAHGGETRWIDCLKGEGAGLDWYVKQLQDKPYIWGNHYLPHDVRVRELGTGKSRLEVLQELGLRNIEIAPRMDIMDGIQALRLLLPRSWFDKDNCKTGIEALRMYRRIYDDKRQEFQSHPYHDWTSHYADAARYFAIAHREQMGYTAPIKRNIRGIV
jgi:hypothetical protein